MVKETKVLSVSLMCFLVLSVRKKNILSKTNFHHTPLIEDNLKWMSGKLGNINLKFKTGTGIAIGTGKRLEINDSILLGDKT